MSLLGGESGFLLEALSEGTFVVASISLESDARTWQKLEELTALIEQPGGNLAKVDARLDRVDLFLDYLKTTEETWIVECNRRRLSGEWGVATIAASIIPEFEGEKERVRRSAEKQRRR